MLATTALPGLNKPRIRRDRQCGLHASHIDPSPWPLQRWAGHWLKHSSPRLRSNCRCANR